MGAFYPCGCQPALERYVSEPSPNVITGHDSQMLVRGMASDINRYVSWAVQLRPIGLEQPPAYRSRLVKYLRCMHSCLDYEGHNGVGERTV